MFTVLVAENSFHRHTSVFEMLNTHFRDECKIQKAKSSHEAFRFIEKEDADIILLDTDMPGISSDMLTRFLQETEGRSIILPIAELSSFDPDAFGNGHTVMDYLLRPFTESELVLTMEEAFQLCRKNATQERNTAQDGLTRNNLVKRKIELYIRDHFHEISSMQDVARAMNYSDTHFCRLFKQCFDVNFSVYLNQFRVGQARQMLAASNQTVKEVSISCGYRDTSYFIRVFKRFTGMTPSDYRIYSQTMTAKKSNKS